MQQTNIPQNISVKPASQTKADDKNIINKNINGYINVFQGQIGRYVKGEADQQYVGIYTDEITTCNVVIVYGKREGTPCFSLLHADTTVSMYDIVEETKWAGEEFKIVVIRHHNQEKSLYEDIKELFKSVRVVALPRNKDAVAVNFGSGTEEPEYRFLCTETEIESLTLYNSHFSMNLFAAYKFNAMFLEVYSQLRTNEVYSRGAAKNLGPERNLYQNRVWTNRELHELFRREMQYPSRRIMFDGGHFCADRIVDTKLIPIAEEAKNVVLVNINKYRNLLLFNVYQEFMAYFRAKEPQLSLKELEQYYDGQCSELAKVFCFLAGRPEVLRTDPKMGYWINIIARYSSNTLNASPVSRDECYWVVDTKNKHLNIDWDNLIIFLTSATDKHPKAEPTLFKSQIAAEGQMKTAFEKSISKGGASKGFIFKFTLPSVACLELFDKKSYEKLAHNITQISFYRRDEKSNMELFDNKTKNTPVEHNRPTITRPT